MGTTIASDEGMLWIQLMANTVLYASDTQRENILSNLEGNSVFNYLLIVEMASCILFLFLHYLLMCFYIINYMESILELSS